MTLNAVADFTAIPGVEPQIDPIYVSVQTTSQITGLSKVTIYRLLAAERLRAVKAGAKTLIEYASIREYSASLPRFVGTTGKQAA